MAIELQNIEVPYGALDVNTDPSEIPLGALTKAENVQSQIDGRYSKRFGFDQMPATGATSAVRLAKRTSELLLIDQNASWNYNSANNAWTGGIPVPHGMTSQEYIALEQSKDYAVGTRGTYGAHTLHAFIDAADGRVHIRLFSRSDHTPVASMADATAIFDIVHIATVGTRIVAFYSSSASQLIKYVLCDPATLTFGTIQTLFSGANVYAGTVGYPKAPFDIYPISATNVCIAWANDVPEIRIASIDVYAHVKTLDTLVAAEIPDGGMAVVSTASEIGAVLWHDSGTGALRVRGFASNTHAMTYAATTVEASGGLVNFNAGLVRISATSLLAVWDLRNVAPLKGAVKWRTVSSAGALGTQTAVNNIYLQSKPYTYNGRFYCNVFAPYSTQWTYFTMLINTSLYMPVAMHSYRTAHYGGAAQASLPESDQVEAGVYAFDSPIAYKFLSTSLPKAGMASYITDYTDPKRFATVEMGSSAFFAASAVFRYDGGQTTENNFLLYPEITDATPGAVGGSGMNNGIYSYIVVFESADSNGNVDRSTTSLPVSVTTVAGAGLGKVTLTIDNLTVTGHIYLTKKIVASIFRTEASRSTYYCVNSVIVDPLVANFTYVDQLSDTLLISRRIIYTQGGILDREPALPARTLTVHQNRMWGVSSADPKLVFYSGDYLPGESPWFSTLQQFRVDPGGDITALAPLDYDLMIFKSDRIFKVTGRGLQQTGTNSDLTPPQIITTDCGCIDPRSVCVIPQGIMFQSAKGIYMLTRGGEISYIGEPIDPFLADFPIVTSATMMPTTREVRFYLSSTDVDNIEGMIIVYNYRDNRWTTHTVFDPLDGENSGTRVDSLVVGNSFYCADPNGIVFVETPDAFRDPMDAEGNPPQYIKMKLATGWIKLAGKQGLVRVQRLLTLNTILDEHGLEVLISKDYVDVVVQTANFTAADLASLPQEQVSIHLQNQQGEAFMVEVSDIESDSDNSSGFYAQGLTFVAGVKRGSFEKTMQAASKA